MALLFNVGPDVIAEPGIGGGPGFALWRPEWVSLQACCVDAQSLPTTTETFQRSLGDGAPTDVSAYADLVQAYRSISGHAADWLSDAFPAAVDLAGDVADYGAITAPAYYPPILTEARLIEQNPHDRRAGAALRTILDTLRQQTSVKAARAGAVAAHIADLADGLDADRDLLGDPEDGGGLVHTYDRRCDDRATAVAERIDRHRELLAGCATDYVRAVIAHGESPTCTWVWPFGTVAAAVVAGELGPAATGALADGRDTHAALLGRADGVSADAHLLLALHLAAGGLEVATRDVAEVLPVVLRLQSVWGGIAADLGALAELIDHDVREVPAAIAGLEVGTAIESWREVARHAEAFRLHAYVKCDPAATMAAWKVATQYASTRAAVAA